MGSPICEVCGAAGDNRCYRKCPFYKPLLKWRRAKWRYQETHCGRFFVDSSENGFWNAYSVDDDFPIAEKRSWTRAEAKEICEDEADRQEREARSQGQKM